MITLQIVSRGDGTAVVKREVIRGLVANELSRTRKNLMKKYTAKEFVSLAVIAVVASGFAPAIVLSAGTAAAVANNYLLLALTLCGAVLSGINGFGRRTVKADSRVSSSRRGPQSGVALTS